jgi:DNA repair exonuclease SbcCD ATPase subunit
MVPMRFESGVGDPAVVELTTSSGSVDSAGAPWRMMAWFSGIALLFVAGLLLWDRRHPLDAPSEPSTGGGVAGSVVAAAMRPVTVPSPGVKEEGDARRKAEHRARAAEERLAVLQDQYRKTLDELQEAQNKLREATTAAADPSAEERAMQAEQRAGMLEEHARSADERARAPQERSRELEDRARIFEREANSSRAELEEMTRLLSEARASADDASDLNLDAAGQEIIGLRAELEGAQTQLSSVRRELEMVRARADRATQLEAELETLRAEVRKAREASTSAAPGSSISPRELEDLRSEVRALRAEEQRAAMLQDELRSVKAELESVAASHRAELIESEVELEEKVRAAREEFQGELARAQARHAEDLAAREEQANARLASVEDGAQKQVDAVQRELGERTKRFANAEDEIAKAQAEAARLGGELTVARAELETTVAQLASRTDELAGMKERLQELERTSSEAVARSERQAAELEEAAKDNIDVNRRLQELESRRQLELADAEGRADLDEILRVTQERLAGQTEKLIAAEERVHTLEREGQIAAAKLEETESELRQQQMAAAMRHIRGDDGAEADQQPAAVPLPDGAPLEDRRATSPFMQELSTDARKSLTRIMGITQILKHKPDAKDQTQLVRQLTTHTRRLEHIVADLADADRLVRGEVELNVRRTDLEPLVRRVVEESGIDADHEVRIETERVVVAVDQVRTEQILSGLLRASGDRTPAKKTIAVRLTTADGGALIAVEDPEPSSDASLGPMVTRFAELQGGWAKVESRENGGSSFKVFLPDGAKPQPPADTSSPSEEAATDDALHIVVDGTASSPVPESSASIDGNALVQELHRLSTAED